MQVQLVCHPYRPSEAGIDVTVESATKYLNGHADLAAGAVAGSADFIKKVSPSDYIGSTENFGVSEALAAVTF